MKSIFLSAGAALSACLLASTPAGAATNLLTNGDCEIGGPPAGSFSNSGSTTGGMDGWVVLGPTRSSISLLNSAYSELNITFNAQSGQTALDLTGGGNKGPTAGVRQTVDTVQGQTYVLNFWLGNADGRENGDNYLGASSLDLRIGGVDQGVFTNDRLAHNGVDWLRVTHSFVATGATTDIAFLNATTGDAYAGLDHVSLTTTAGVPEPSGWALMITGFGLTGAMLRRRSQHVMVRGGVVTGLAITPCRSRD